MFIVRDESVASQRVVPIWCVGSDGTTPATGEAGGQPQFMVGGAFQGNTTATLSAWSAAAGQYYVTLTQAECATLGPGVVRYNSANALETETPVLFVAANSYNSQDLGLDGVNVASFDAGAITAAAIATNAIDADAIAANAITSAKIATDAIGTAQIAAGTYSGVTVGTDTLANSVRSNIAADVWNEVLTETTHSVVDSAGRRLRALGSITTSHVSQVAPSASVFSTALSAATDNWFSNKILTFTSGDLAGQARVIFSYEGATRSITFDEPLTAAPADNDTFDIILARTHPITQIATQVIEQAALTPISSTVTVDGIDAAAIATAIDADAIAANAITAAKIATDAITTDKIAAGTYSDVTFSTGGTAPSLVTLAPGSHSDVTIQGVTRTLNLTTNDDKTGYNVSSLDANTVDASAIADNAIDAGAIAANAITSAKIATDAIGTAQIAAGTYSGTTFGSAATILAGGIAAASFGASAIDAAALATDAGQEIADRLLLRDVAGGADSARSVGQALYALRNRVEVGDSVMTVYQADDTNSAWTASITTAAFPLGEFNPQ
jgi:hypothetical protein